jgi:hypothetical protein
MRKQTVTLNEILCKQLHPSFIKQCYQGHNYFHYRYVSIYIYCATNRKVAGSIPDGVIGIFHWRDPSDRTMALGLTQPLTEMSTRSISWE